MRKTNKMSDIVAVTLGVLAAATIGQAVAHAGQRGMGMGMGMKGGLPPIPDLTQEQKQKITDLKNGAIQQTAPLHDEMAGLWNGLKTLWTADALDRDAISKRLGEIDAVHRKVRDVWADFFFKVHDILTPAQRTWLAQHHGKGGRGMGGGMAGAWAAPAASVRAPAVDKARGSSEEGRTTGPA